MTVRELSATGSSEATLAEVCCKSRSKPRWSLGIPAVTSVAWSPDGRQVASAGSGERTVKIWDPATGKELRTLRGSTGNTVHSGAWSPDGRRLAAATSDRTIRIWDVTTGDELRALVGHDGSVSSLAWSPDGRQLATASNDKAIRIWDAATGEETLAFRGCTDGVTLF